MKIVSATSEEKSYSLSSFGRTSCLDNLLRNARNGEVRILSTKICRLHSQSRCKFGKDCKNVHMCPEAQELVAAKKQAPLAVDLSCGISNCSNGSYAPSVSDSPTDRPLSVPLDAKVLMQSDKIDADFSFFSREWNPAAPSPKFDLSAFEATIRSLCEGMTTESAMH